MVKQSDDTTGPDDTELLRLTLDLAPASIVVVDGEGRIVAINTMPPCESDAPQECPSYPAGAAYHAALEVNAGYFAERGIQVGDCVSVPALAGFCRSE